MVMPNDRVSVSFALEGGGEPFATYDAVVGRVTEKTALLHDPHWGRPLVADIATLKPTGPNTWSLAMVMKAQS